MGDKSEGVERARRLIEGRTKKCDPFYHDTTSIWSWLEDTPLFGRIVCGKRVLDIGCGPNGGLSELVLGLGAIAYLGVDVCDHFIYCSSNRKNTTKNASFLCDDPVYAIRTLSEPYLVISSGLFDTAILRDHEYARQLIHAIYDHTQPDEYTIHSNYDFYREFHYLFVLAGFRHAKVDLQAAFGVYQKPAVAGAQ